MGKVVVPNINTKFDPVGQQVNAINELGIVPISSNTSFSLDEQQSSLNPFSQINASQYGDNISLYSDDSQAQGILDERRAQSQSAAEQLLKGIGHMASTMGTEILKTPGYLLGGFGALGNDKSVIENIVDNDWVNAFERLDESIKDQMPVYLTKDIQEGGIGKKLLSSAWWATTGADGIGFLLSMYAPGRIVGALGAGEKVGGILEGLAHDTKLAKTLTASGILESTNAGAKITKKGIERINSLNAVALNTYIESASEAANTFDNVRKNYFEANPDGTDEEASKIASEAAANVMKANVGVLALSNVFDELFLFKGFGKSAEKTASDSTLGKLYKNGILDPKSVASIKKEGIKEFLAKAPKELAMNFAKEGLFEEGLQTKIQQHYENVANGKTTASFSEDVLGNYFETLMTDPEMQESVVLGGILGGGASMVSVASDIKAKNDFLFGKNNSMPSFLGKLFNKKEKTESKGFVNIMNENFINSTRTILDIAERDENDNPIFENGKVKISEAKLQDMMQQKDGLLILNQLHNLAILEGNKADQDSYGDLLSYNYFLPFLQQEGGYEVLNQHISNQLVELMAKKSEAATGVAPSDSQKQTIKENLLAKAKEYKAIYDEVDTTTNTELYVPVDDRSTYQPWKSTVRDRKMQALVAFNSANKALTEIDSKYPNITTEKLSEEDLDRMTPVEIQEAITAKYIKEEYTKRRDSAKQAYLDLSNKTKLKEDYNKFKETNNKDEAVKEALDQENKDVDEKIVAAFNASDFEKQINNAGYETKKSDSVKGFYLTDQRIILEDATGKRVTLESQYNASTKTVEYVSKDATGKITKVTDANGNFTPQFISKGYKPISKAQIQVERTKLAFQTRKQAQLKLLKEFIDYRNSKISAHKKEIENINTEIEQYNTELENIKQDIGKLYSDRINGKLKNKRQSKINLANLESSLKTIEDTIENLQNRKQYLEETIPRIEILVQEYVNIRDEIINSPEPISFKRELEKVEKLLKENDFISDIRETISKLEKTIQDLELQRDSIKKVLSSHKVFEKIIKLKEGAYTKAYSAFDRFFDGIPYFYSIRRLHQMVTDDPKAVIAGDTLLKNNIISNAIEITKWLNANPVDRYVKFGKNDPVTEQDVYDKMIDIFTPYVATIEELSKQYPYTPEEIYDLKSQVFITGREIEELQKQVAENKALLSLDETYRKYITLQRLLTEKVEDRYNELRSEVEEKNVESSQKQAKTAVEPAPEASMREIFLRHSLPQTPFSTTGKSVLYEKEGNRKGKDKIDENGFPVLNDNSFQRLWFYTIDKLADEIQNYTLTPVVAKYDGSDEIQRVLEANFPDQSQRTDNDIFVFLTDKNGNIVRVDNQGNRLTTGGTPVFTSIRKVDEVFPTNQSPRISPEYIISEYFKFLKLNVNFDYQKVKDKKVGEIIAGKEAREKLKNLIDNDNTMETLFALATDYAKQQYIKFINELSNNTEQVIEIEGVTKGYPLYQLDKNGKSIQNKPLKVFKNVSLKKDTYGKEQLQGAKLGVVVNNQVKVGDRFISLPEGSVYLQLENDDFVTLQSRTLNSDESHTIMYLLSLANGDTPLNTITVDLPNKKDGTPYYYFLNNRKIESPLPVFFRKTQTGGESFSLLETMINYGLKAQGKNKKGEIYIQSGKVIFTTFEGEKKEVKLSELNDSIKNNKFEKHNEDVAALHEFLLQKRFNVNNTMLANNPRFLYPQFKNGKLSFDVSKTYYEYMFDNALTTSSTTKEGYPSRLQRNVIYSPTLISKSIAKAKPTIAAKETPNEIVEPPKVTAINKAQILDIFISKYIDTINTKLTPELRAEITNEVLSEKIRSNSSLLLKLEEVGQILKPEDIQYMVDKILNPKAEESSEEVVENVAKTEQPVKETPAERLARLRGDGVKLTNSNTPSVDKRISPDALLEQYIKDNVVQKNCK